MSSQTPDSAAEMAALDQMIVRLIIVAELLLNPSPGPDTAETQDALSDTTPPQKSASEQADV